MALSYLMFKKYFTKGLTKDFIMENFINMYKGVSFFPKKLIQSYIMSKSPDKQDIFPLYFLSLLVWYTLVTVELYCSFLALLVVATIKPLCCYSLLCSKRSYLSPFQNSKGKTVL